jgi:hypothetical protein
VSEFRVKGMLSMSGRLLNVPIWKSSEGKEVRWTLLKGEDRGVCEECCRREESTLSAWVELLREFTGYEIQPVLFTVLIGNRLFW